MPLDFRLSGELLEFRDRAEAFLRQEMDPQALAGHLDPRDLTGVDISFERAHQRRAGAGGFIGVSAPQAYGGGQRRLSFQAVYQFAAGYFEAPSIDTAWTLCGAPLVAYGTDQQKQRWLPQVIAGQVTGCIAYTESEAGSDLAAVSTTATPVGAGWCLDGVKTLVTGAHKADLCVTLARTSQGPTRHALTMFAFELPQAGLTIVRRATANGWTLSEMRFSQAFVGPDAVLGQVGAGWKQVRDALASERSGMVHLGRAKRILELLGAWVSAQGDDIVARREYAQLQTDFLASLRLGRRVMWLQDQGEPAVIEAAAAKIYTTELLQRIAATGASLLGEEATVTATGAADGLDTLRGQLGWEAVERIHPTIGAGANPVLRDLVARVALGLGPQR